MSSPSTHQDSPKVPEWPVITTARQRPGDRPLIDSTGRKPHGWKRIETETYISVSALLSAEVVETLAKLRIDRQTSTTRIHWATWDAVPESIKRPQREIAREDLQAAVDHLGGTDAH